MRQYFHVARIRAAHGVRGELKLDLLSEEPGRLRTLSTVFLLSPQEEVLGRRRLSVRPKEEQIARLEGVDSREAAEALKAHFLSVPREEALPLGEGRYFVDDLIGLSVEAEDGQVLGSIREVLPYAPNDILVIRRPGKKDLLLPVQNETFLRADLELGRAYVQVPPGLLEIYE